MRRLTMAALGCLVLGALAAPACGDDAEETPGGDSGAQTIEVVATDFAFEPAQISAEPGQAISITLKNDGEVEHSFTIDDLEVDAEAEGGEEATAVLTAPDESVEFYCRYHPTRMRGTLDVGGSGAGAPTQAGSDPGYIQY